MSDGLKSHIRTWWPILLGYLSALLVRWVAAKLGMQIDNEVAFALVGAVMSGLVYSFGRWLESRKGANGIAELARSLGRFVLSLGLVLERPTYQRQDRV